GERAWDHAFGDVISTLITIDDDLVVGTRAGSVFRVAGDGAVRWQRRLNAEVITAAVAGDRIAIATEDQVRLLDPDGGPVAAFDWPDRPVELAPFRTGDATGLYLRDAAGGQSCLGLRTDRSA